MSNLASYFGLIANVPDNTVGLELEMESVQEVRAEKIKFLGAATEDNSLRNNGLEFISVPVSIPNALEFCEKVLHSKSVLWHDPTQRCSERGSIHVHVNMQHMTVLQTIAMLRFYCLLEPQFFAEVAPHRRNNIYCVPLMATSMPHYIQQKGLNSMVAVWHKYTALNAKRLPDLCTLEFRHLQATDDLKLIERWLKIIMNLKQAAVDIRDANLTWPQVLELHYRVFGCAATQLSDMEICFQEDVVSRRAFDSNIITQRIKEAKQCAA